MKTHIFHLNVFSLLFSFHIATHSHLQMLTQRSGWQELPLSTSTMGGQKIALWGINVSLLVPLGRVVLYGSPLYPLLSFLCWAWACPQDTFWISEETHLPLSARFLQGTNVQNAVSENLTKRFSALMEMVSPLLIFWDTCPLCQCLLLI